MKTMMNMAIVHITLGALAMAGCAVATDSDGVDDEPIGEAAEAVLNGTGQSAKFGGTGAPYASFTLPTTNTSMELWFKTSSDGKLIQGWNSGITASDRWIALSGGRLVSLWHYGSGSSQLWSPVGTSYKDDKWHHVAQTAASGSTGHKLYVDGVLVASGTGGTSTTATTKLMLGDNGVAFTREIDEVRIWNVPRSATQISGNRYRELPTASSSAMIQGWRFNGSLANTRSGAAAMVVPSGGSVTYPTSTAPIYNTYLSTALASTWSHAAADFTDAFTVEAAVYSTLPAQGSLNYLVLNYGRYSLSIDANGYPAFGVATTGGGSAYDAKRGATALNANKWYRVGFTYNPSASPTCNLYFVNQAGTLFSGLASGVTCPTGNPTLSGSSSTFNVLPPAPSGSKIDDVRLWNLVRTSTQFKNDAWKYVAGQSAGLVGMWHFNGAVPTATTTTPDSSASLMHLTLGTGAVHASASPISPIQDL